MRLNFFCLVTIQRAHVHAASESILKSTKGARRKLVASLTAARVYGGPANGEVASGTELIQKSGFITTITQDSPTLSLA